MKKPFGRLKWVYQRTYPLIQKSTLYNSILVTQMHKDIWKKTDFDNIIARDKIREQFNNSIFIVLNPIQPLNKFKDLRIGI